MAEADLAAEAACGPGWRTVYVQRVTKGGVAGFLRDGSDRVGRLASERGRRRRLPTRKTCSARSGATEATSPTAC